MLSSEAALLDVNIRLRDPVTPVIVPRGYPGDFPAETVFVTV